MKVKNDHRSKFSNLSNWKEEAWKKSELQRVCVSVSVIVSTFPIFMFVNQLLLVD